MSLSSDLKDRIAIQFGNKIRLRACGILIFENKILLVKHIGLGPKGELWSPPGGGVEFGETLSQALKREFFEETNLEIVVGQWLFAYEYLHPPLQTVECFFDLQSESPISSLKLGKEPEMDGVNALNDIRFWSFKEVQDLGLPYFHGLFSRIDSLEDIKSLTHFISLA